VRKGDREKSKKIRGAEAAKRGKLKSGRREQEKYRCGEMSRT